MLELRRQDVSISAIAIRFDTTGPVIEKALGRARNIERAARNGNSSKEKVLTKVVA